MYKQGKQSRQVSVLPACSTSSTPTRAWVELSIRSALHQGAVTFQSLESRRGPLPGLTSWPHSLLILNETDTVTNIWILDLFPILVRILEGEMKLTRIQNFQEATVFILCFSSLHLETPFPFWCPSHSIVKHKYTEVGAGEVGRGVTQKN